MDVPALASDPVQPEIVECDVLEADITQRALPPIHRLPPELLVKIILFIRGGFSPGDKWSLIESSDDPDTAPLCFGRVCSRWRSIVHGTPALWTYIAFRTLRGIKRDESIRAKWLIEKSCDMAVTLVFYDQSKVSGVDHEMDVSVRDTLATFLRLGAPRIRKLFLFICPASLPEPQAEWIFPELQNAHFKLVDCTYSRGMTNVVDGVVRFLAHSKNLWRVDLNSTLPITLEHECRPGDMWTRLTCLSMNMAITFITCAALLRSSPVLKSVCFGDVYAFSPVVWSGRVATPTTHGLQLLILQFHPEAEIDEFFSQFSFPNLHSLEIEAIYCSRRNRSPTVSCRAALTWLHDNTPGLPLAKLILHSIMIDLDDLKRVATRFSNSLTSLSLNRGCKPTLIEELTTHDDPVHQISLPLLRHLFFRYMLLERAEGYALLQVLENLGPPSHPALPSLVDFECELIDSTETAYFHDKFREVVGRFESRLRYKVSTPR